MGLRFRLLCLLAAGVIFAGACGDDGGATTTTASASSATTTTASASTTSTTGAAPAATELRITFEGVTGIQGKILVATVWAGSMDPDAFVGAVCLPVDSDPFTGSAVVATTSPDDPCNQDAPYGVPLTAGGEYSYFVGAFEPGQEPSVCAIGEVGVDGPTEVVISTADLSSANCLSLG